MPGNCAVLNRRCVIDLLGFPKILTASGERRQENC